MSFKKAWLELTFSLESQLKNFLLYMSTHVYMCINFFSLVGYIMWYSFPLSKPDSVGSLTFMKEICQGEFVVRVVHHQEPATPMPRSDGCRPIQIHTVLTPMWFSPQLCRDLIKGKTPHTIQPIQYPRLPMYPNQAGLKQLPVG